VAKIPLTNNIKIYNTDTIDSFYKFLRAHESFFCSEFKLNIPLGENIGERVSNQSLERLTFDNAFFDVVITEDVLEHVRLYEKAVREIYRILKPNGYFIFTIPFYFDRMTVTRVDTSGKRDVHILPPQYHGGPLRGKMLSYRTFGLDFLDFLKSIGFTAEARFSKYADLTFGIVDSYVFIAQKKAE
jgi:SAM-dependent methyltransferase